MNRIPPSLRRLRTLSLAAACAVLMTAPAAVVPAVAAPRIPVLREQVVRLVNERRAEAGCSPLRQDADLRQAAQRHSVRMARTGTFSHRGVNGSMPWDRAENAGYDAARMAENIARGQRTAADVVDAWMHSPPHRRAMLDCAYRDIGVGVHHGPDGPWWTQELAAGR